jgi:hypothetical protein
MALSSLLIAIALGILAGLCGVNGDMNNALFAAVGAILFFIVSVTIVGCTQKKSNPFEGRVTGSPNRRPRN